MDLNTVAAVDGAPKRFEVLTLGQLSWSPINLWPYYLVPPIVKKFDIDLVLYFQEPLHVDLSYYLTGRYRPTVSRLRMSTLNIY